ncbi:sulfotransferase [Candidatus Gracilibacteria bacterium]|nr:sulfotransferase [Candidatus Gracilibacteria bacterium]NJM88334.1 sulfotransferase [Hydrococcus sp. RU_2_2]NJP20878.1 sulfotransferase [Hydrococcus sp. CRU_1_1]
MTLPNFLIIGAAKAGTTALHTYLQQHPQVYMTPDKETNFFAFEGEHLNFQGIGDEAINQFSITDLKSYQAEFQNVSDEKAIGEACPLYLYHSKAPERIYSYIPHVRLIAILRHPVDRAYANYLHIIRDDREPCRDFERALQQEKKRIDENWEWFWHYIQLGYYAAQLQRYYEIFARDQIRVYLYEDLCQNSLTLMQDIFRFLEINDNFIPDMTIRPNKSGMPKNLLFHQLLTKPNPLKSLLKPLFPSTLRQKIQHQNLTTPKISSEARAFLLDLYREDILKCQDLIDRDLSAWLN